LPSSQEFAFPRYHFNIYDGAVSIDDDGFELPSQNAGHEAAAELAAEMLRHRPQKVFSHGEWRVEMTDDRGVTLFALNVSATPKPLPPPVTRSRR
jgi:hypothetical protein